MNVWRNMAISVDSMEKIQEKNYDYIKKYGVTKMISNTKNSKSVILPDTLDYYVESIQPTLASLGIKLIVSIVSDNLITKKTTQKFHQVVSGIKLVEVRSLEEAEEVVKQN